MAPRFALIGLPILQVSHEIYADVLVKHNLCEIATNSNELENGLKALKEKADQSSNTLDDKELIYDAIGYSSNWSTNLRNAILHTK